MPEPTPAPAPATTAEPAPATTTTTEPPPATEPTAEIMVEPQPVEVINWPPPPPGASHVVTLPSGLAVRVDYTATFGDLFVGVTLILAVVVFIGSKLLDRIRGVL